VVYSVLTALNLLVVSWYGSAQNKLKSGLALSQSSWNHCT